MAAGTPITQTAESSPIARNAFASSEGLIRLGPREPLTTTWGVGLS